MTSQRRHASQQEPVYPEAAARRGGGGAFALERPPMIDTPKRSFYQSFAWSGIERA